MNRRRLLLTAGAASGGLLIGWSLLPARSRLGAASLMGAQGGVALNGWIKITPAGDVVLAMPRCEMGQGVQTALPMLAAEELYVPLARMRVEQASSDAIYGNVARFVASLPFVHPADQELQDGYGRVIQASQWLAGKLAREIGVNATGGSTSVSDLWEVVRTAAATARASLLGAASLQWRLPKEELTTEGGLVAHASGRSASYGQLAKQASSTPPGNVKLKPRQQWTLIGTAAQRLDVPAKVDGTARFGIDVRLPGMKFAAVRLPPMFGGAPARVDADAALRMPGAERLVVFPPYAGCSAGIAVVGRSYWEALQAARAVEVEWRSPSRLLDTSSVEQRLHAALAAQEGVTFHSRGSLSAAERDASRSLEAVYSAPFLAHACLEPMNCTAQVTAGRVHIWVPTQVPEMSRSIAAEVAGVAPAAVTVHSTLLGGGFGRRLEVDFVAQAVRVAMDCAGAPVQLTWPREEDMRHDFYRPMQVATLRASIAGGGEVTGLRIKSAGDVITPAYIRRVLPGLAALSYVPDKTASEGLSDLPYAIANQRVSHIAVETGVPVGYWRSVGHSHNAFFSESFMDELAAATREDPGLFRLRLLGHAPRHRAVLRLAMEKSSWSSPPPAGRARGLALHESFGSIVAQVAEVSLASGRVHVHRVTCAIDCGTAVNPQIVAQQMEGSVIFGLTAALYGRVDIHRGIVQQGNFHQYPLLGMSSAPEVRTWIVSSDRAPSGVGEPGVPPVAPAAANALFALTGRRVRKLPLLVG